MTRDDEFDEYLKRRTLLPQGVDDKLEPPRAIDDAVLDQARQAIRTQKSKTATARWAVPVALAATILLCLSVVLNVSLRPRTEPQPPTAERADYEMKSLQAARETPPARSAAPASAEPAAPRPALATAPAPAAPPTAARRAAAPPASASTAPPPAPGSIPMTEMAANQAPAVPAPDKRSDADLRQESAVTDRRVDVSAVAPHPQDPKVWLAQIDALRSAGKKSEADAELRRFQAAFPGYSMKDAAPTSSEPAK